MFDEHNSMMMLGLLNTLYNNGTITKQEREDIIELGETVETNNEERELKNG